MERDRWDVVQRIMLAALERPAEERRPYVERSAGADAALIDEVMELVEAHLSDPDFLEAPIATLDPDAAQGEGTRTPRTIGPYEVVRPLGRGGMGEVFLARQVTEEFTRSVAVKVIKRGMDSDEVVRRFRREQSILAGLVHPHIAQLHDAGITGDGRPYFVMEYVDGRRIDDFVRDRGLDLDARLALFRTVCAAVHHAHRNLVVHRDLKPGNVLVTEDGTAKLVDFGIGKVLDDTDADASLTRTQARVLTPDYAAPEQITGGPVTTAADVWALGALLYELLAGRRAFSGADRPEAGDVTGAGPLSPLPKVADDATSGLNARDMRRLRGDLDNIVARAMHPEPDRRYDSAAALSDDLDRFLNGLPVQARPDSLGYRARKFVSRNRWAVATSAAVAAGLVAVTVTTAIQSRRVARERDKAEEVRGFLLETFGASAADGLTGDSVTVRQLLDRQAALVPTAYADDPELEAEMSTVLAEAYERLGLYDDAAQLADRALALRRTLHAPPHRELAAASNLLGWITFQLGDGDRAIELLEASVADWRAVGRAEPAGLARALNDLGVVYDRFERRDEAESLLREALETRRSLGDGDDRSVAITSNNLAALLYRKGDYTAADSLGTVALNALRASVGPDHQRAIIAQSNLATIRMVGGDWDGAAELQADLISRQARIQGRDHPRTASAMVIYANTLVRQGRWDRAEEIAAEALAIQERVLGPDHRDLSGSLRTLANVYVGTGRAAEAVPLMMRALALSRESFGDEHAQVAEAESGLGTTHEAAGDPRAALLWFRAATERFERVLGSSHPRARVARLDWAEAAVGADARVLADSLLSAATSEASTNDADRVRIDRLRRRLSGG